MHLTPAHALVLLPVIALIGTPLFPFVNNHTVILGFPVMAVWIAAWGVITTGILGMLYRTEPELSDPSDPSDASDATGPSGVTDLGEASA
ncbi:hypothetical protein [Corynebacterium nuruki]|uniref:DUF3311 domain-containing protein n=1 Tax=Corynebacterium nuruki TaxID=1032851 RepID=A0A3D4SW26_9CORY|nr:hypothetical protein [Corynebacterium nuruki]HCT13305.1 hypothetical protein [Corynebacterium nuruki]